MRIWTVFRMLALEWSLDVRLMRNKGSEMMMMGNFEVSKIVVDNAGMKYCLVRRMRCCMVKDQSMNKA